MTSQVERFCSEPEEAALLAYLAERALFCERLFASVLAQSTWYRLARGARLLDGERSPVVRYLRTGERDGRRAPSAAHRPTTSSS